MIIEKYDSGLLHSNMYVIKENDHVMIIDPCKKMDVLNDETVDYLLLTHEHYDHISGVNEWKEKHRAPLVCSEACAKNIVSSKKNMSRYFDYICEIQTWVPQNEIGFKAIEYSCKADITFSDSMSFEWQGHRVLLMEIPGHSSGSIGIDIDNEHFFSGDSLLKDYPIELRFPSGSKKQWNEVGRKRIEALKNGVRIWPGHFNDFII